MNMYLNEYVILLNNILVMEVILGSLNVLNMNIYLKQMYNILLIHFITLSTEL